MCVCARVYGFTYLRSARTVKSIVKTPLVTFFLALIVCLYNLNADAVQNEALT